MKRAGLAVILAGLVLFGAVWLREAWSASGCHDRGGSFNDRTGQCDFVTTHERTSFLPRHGALSAGLAAALVLGSVLYFRKSGAVSPTPAHPGFSSAARRAFRFCLGLALLAIVLGVVTLTGVPSLKEIAGKQGQAFWGAALLLGLDALILSVAIRASRATAVVAAFLFGLQFVLLAGIGILGGYFAYGLSGGEMPISQLAGWIGGCALMAAAQWFCLSAAYKRI
jgi:hypothetical protein